MLVHFGTSSMLTQACTNFRSNTDGACDTLHEFDTCRAPGNTCSSLDTPSELVHHSYNSTFCSFTRWQGVQPSLEIFQVLDAIEAEGTECKCLSKRAFKGVSTDKIRHIIIYAPRALLPTLVQK